ncbi:MAG: hypothetical protein KME16_05545 [Scytolyngbya sp. HA4215-MV1]|nr:hypothetical protein [Scytolyngbya sp. HA4215-MV1]
MTVINRKLANSQRSKSEPEIPTICYVYPNGEVIVTRVIQRHSAKIEPEQEKVAMATATPPSNVELAKSPSEGLNSTLIQPPCAQTESVSQTATSVSLIKRPCVEIEPSYRNEVMATVIQQLHTKEKRGLSESLTVTQGSLCPQTTEASLSPMRQKHPEKTGQKHLEKRTDSTFHGKSKSQSVFALDDKATFLLAVD